MVVGIGEDSQKVRRFQLLGLCVRPHLVVVTLSVDVAARSMPAVDKVLPAETTISIICNVCLSLHLMLSFNLRALHQFPVVLIQHGHFFHMCMLRVRPNAY